MMEWSSSPRPLRRLCVATVIGVSLTAPPLVYAQEAAAWLARAAQAARTLSYTGTMVYHHSGNVETSRLVHLYEGGQEYEKLSSLDGPAREVIRSEDEIRCYFPDAKIVRIDPRTFRNAFPALTVEQQQTLSRYYEFKRMKGERVAGLAAEVVRFEPKDGMRYGHMFWSEAASGLLLKARLLTEKGDVVEQFAFTDINLNAKIDREMVKPSWSAAPPDWQIKHVAATEVVRHETGWSASKLPPGFVKIMEGYRTLRDKRYPVAHLVFSDGLVAVSVFIEPLSATPIDTGPSQQGGMNVYSMKAGEHLVTVLGEAPPATVRQIAQSVAKR